MIFYIIVLITATMAGFFTGLLGIGGGLIIFPAFLFVIPALGFKSVSIYQITGIAAIQILIGSFFAFLSHRKDIRIKKQDLIYFGLSAGLGSLSGAIFSAYISQKALLIIYFSILVIAFLSMTIVNIDGCEEQGQPKKNLVKILCFCSGMCAGALGLAGAVLYIPTIRYFYKIPTKNCIGIITFIVFCGAIMTFTGKAVTHQIPYDLVLFTLIGAFIGAKAGAYISKKLSSAVLKKILLLIIIITGLRVFMSILG